MYETAADKTHHRVLVAQEARVLRASTKAWRSVSPEWISQTWMEQIPSLAAKVGSVLPA